MDEEVRLAGGGNAPSAGGGWAKRVAARARRGWTKKRAPAGGEAHPRRAGKRIRGGRRVGEAGGGAPVG
jgi:hypothetical protein